MKKRLVKKWIKRYITPHIENLPTTDCYATQITTGYDDNGFEYVVVCQKQHVIVNGFKNSEGEVSRLNNSLRQAIIQTGDLINDIINSHDHILLRVRPEVRGKWLYVRLITE